MSPQERRRVEVRRRRQEIIDLIDGLPRQHLALDNAMRAFGDDFELRALKSALAPTADIDVYNQAQALERAMTRVQNMLAELAIAGVKLACLEPPDSAHGGRADRSFAALRDAGVTDPSVARRLRKAQVVRNLLEHDYEAVSPIRLHRTVEDVYQLTFEFARPFRAWINPFLYDPK